MPTTFRGRRALRKTVSATKKTLFPGVKSLPAIKRKAKLVGKKNKHENNRLLLETQLHSRRADRAVNHSRSFFNPMKWIRAPFIASHIFRLKRKGKYEDRQIRLLREAITEMGEVIHAHHLAEGRMPVTYTQRARQEYTKQLPRMMVEIIALRDYSYNAATKFSRRNKVRFAEMDPRINTVLSSAQLALLTTVNPEKIVLISAYFRAIQQSLKIKDNPLTIALVNNLSGITP